MKKIIILVVSVLMCFCYAMVGAEAAAFPLTEDDIETEIGDYYSVEILVSLASSDGLGSWDYQDSVKFVDVVPLEGPDSTKVALTNSIVESFFDTKALPTGLHVTSFVLENPYDFETDPDGDYDNVQLRITIQGTVPLDFDVTGYEDDLIEMSIPKYYLFNYEDDTPLTLHPTFSTGKYKLTCVKYDVEFDVQGHGVAPDTQSVQKGFYATRPDDPSESNYNFLGWYCEAECENEFVFEEEEIVENTIVYAGWEYVAPVVIEEPTFKIPLTGIE